MSALEMLGILVANGCDFTLTDGDLALEVPVGTVTREQLQLMKNCKSELVRKLKGMCGVHNSSLILKETTGERYPDRRAMVCRVCGRFVGYRLR